MSKDIIIGMDPGKNGAIVLILRDGRVLKKEIFPLIGKELDIIGVNKNFMEYKDRIVHAYLEQIHAIFGASAGSTFTFGRVYGMLESLLVGHGIAYTLVQPKIWQKVIFNGIPEMRKPGKMDKKTGKTRKGRVDTKAMALLASKRLFPSVDLRPTERSKKPHDGLCDALLIAEYGRRNNV